jgi:hypothetical protein
MSHREITFGTSLPVGIPREINTRIIYVASLLKNLPPLNPVESTYNFSLDADDVKEVGTMYVFNCALEIVF